MPVSGFVLVMILFLFEDESEIPVYQRSPTRLVNVTPVHFKVLEKYLEIGVVVEKGFALLVDDMNGENAVKVVGLHEAAVVTKKSELLVELELMTDYRFEMGHGVSPVTGQGGKREPGRGSRTGTSSETLDEAAVMDEEPPKLVFSGLDRVERAKVLGLHCPRRQKVLDLEDGDHF